MKKYIFGLLSALPFICMSQVADSAARLLNLQGAINFRDMGGYKTTNGRQVKWNKVFRSADLSQLSMQDLQLLTQKHINTIIDFRSNEEVSKAKDQLPIHANYLQLPAGSEQTNGMMKAMQYIDSGDSMMIAFYSLTDHLSAKYKPFFQQLLQLPATSALVFHCTAGKDRTGIGAAFLLCSLGVPQQTIMADYLASNIYRKDANQQMVKMMVQLHIKEQVAKDVATVKPEYLQAMFNAINKQFGSMDQFLETQLGIGTKERAMLQKMYTQ